jgi:recombination protein RecT
METKNKLQGYSLKSFNEMLTAPNTSEYLSRVLGERKMSFISNLTSLVANNEKLQECKPVTLMYAALKATSLDLPLDQNLGYAYVIPFNTKSRDLNGNEIVEKVAQFQIGYKGFKQLSLRTGQFKALNSTDVRDGEIISRNRLTGEILFDFVQDDELRKSKKIIGFVAYFELMNGFKQMVYMSTEELKNHGMRYSKTFSSEKKYIRESSRWVTEFEAMAQKTVMKLNLSRNAPLSVEMQNAIRFDQSVMIEENTPKYIDNQPEEQNALQILEENTPEFTECVRSLANGATIPQIKAKFDVSESVEAKLIEETFNVQ